MISHEFLLSQELNYVPSDVNVSFNNTICWVSQHYGIVPSSPVFPVHIPELQHTFGGKKLLLKAIL